MLSAVLAVIAARDKCSGTGIEATPSAGATRGIPARYLTLYQQAGRASGVPWPVLAAIGALESDHGRSRAPGARAGVNSYGCCAGPMQFNTRDGPPSTWNRYGLDGDDDGTTGVYDPDDAIPSAASYLRALLRAADGNLSQALFGYNHSPAYVRDVLARARAYARAGNKRLATTTGEPTDAIGCAEGDLAGPAGPANLRDAERVTAPRAYRALPSWARAGPGGPAVIDARLYDNALWILRRYRLRVSAAREAGHNAHGDGTALDLIPAEGNAQAIWDRSAGALALDLGWTRACARSGTRPTCRLAPAIQFIGYDEYPPARLTAHPHRRLPRPTASVLGLAALRHQPPLRPLPLGDGVRRPASRRPGPPSGQAREASHRSPEKRPVQGPQAASDGRVQASLGVADGRCETLRAGFRAVLAPPPPPNYKRTEGDAGVADLERGHALKCVPFVGRSPAHITEPPLRHTPLRLCVEVPAQGDGCAGGGSACGRP